MDLIQEHTSKLQNSTYLCFDEYYDGLTVNFKINNNEEGGFLIPCDGDELIKYENDILKIVNNSESLQEFEFNTRFAGESHFKFLSEFTFPNVKKVIMPHLEGATELGKTFPKLNQINLWLSYGIEDMRNFVLVLPKGVCITFEEEEEHLEEIFDRNEWYNIIKIWESRGYFTDIFNYTNVKLCRIIRTGAIITKGIMKAQENYRERIAHPDHPYQIRKNKELFEEFNKISINTN